MLASCCTIKLNNLAVGYPQKHGVRIVAEGMNAALQSGRLTCLIGENGIGKSTLLRTLSAFQPPVSGEIIMTDGEKGGEVSLSSLTSRQLAKLIGVVLTEKSDLQQLTVEEIVGLGRSPYTDFWGRLDDEDRAVVEDSMRLTGLLRLRGRYAQTLSDGERQKMMIAKALAQQTPVIFLDEPTAFLDYPSKVEMLRLLQRLAHDTGKIIFLSTHDLELALQIADELWLLERRSAETPATLCCGTPETLAGDGTLGRFISRPGISFDAHTLAIRLTAE